MTFIWNRLRRASRHGFDLWLCTLMVLPLLSQAQDSEAPTVLPTTNATPAQPMSWGTGFVVSEGYVLTALHVVKGRTSVLIGPVGHNPVGQPRWVLAQVLQTDAALDLALLKARIELPPLPLYPGMQVPLGLEVSVIGYPQPRIQGMSKKITQGIINGYRNENSNNTDSGFMQISAEVSQGNSGGPVLGPDGTVVGMVQRKLNSAKIAERTQDLLVNVNYALRSSLLIQFLQTTPATIRQQNLSLSTVLRPYQLYEQTQGSVVSIIARGGSPAAEPKTTP
ncbi:serine protease [Limnohabitans sp. T6-5]|uniref:S1 family peptidase n=1 Tax=Limnohabitans sp. T6-5 TaxID=1100724 RepID=UPI001304FC19|nr:serine protease [Limnohabitans sp. T6-5]